MQVSHGYLVSAFGVLMFGILQGVCLVLADASTKTEYMATGSSLDLTLDYPRDKVSSVKWKFNEGQFARYTQNQYSHQNSQFTGRVIEDKLKVGITVQDLRTQDSGTFLVVIDGTEDEYPTKKFIVYIESPIQNVQIEKNQTWKLSTNSCDVSVKCAANGTESVFYQWSGYKSASGDQLQFSLSPAEGAVTLNCTAANNISNITATETLRCRAEQPSSVFHVEALLSALKPISSVVAASPYLLVTIILGVKCCKARGHRGRQYAVTVIEE